MNVGAHSRTNPAGAGKTRSVTYAACILAESEQEIWDGHVAGGGEILSVRQVP